MDHPTAPILEFDHQGEAIIVPQPTPMSQPTPRGAVICFFQDVLEREAAANRLTVIGQLKSEMGPNPIYLYRDERGECLVVHPGVGAPLAVGFLEEIIPNGVQDMIACGGCGVLDRNIAAGHPVLLTGAVRDEGTSYHYLPAGREIHPHPQAVEAIETVLTRRGVDFRKGKSWTTDAIYRETTVRRNQRMAEGCCVVEMEASAFFALAQFRGVRFGQIVYGGDLVVPEGWDPRRWDKRTGDRELIFDLALDACFELMKK